MRPNQPRAVFLGVLSCVAGACGSGAAELPPDGADGAFDAGGLSQPDDPDGAPSVSDPTYDIDALGLPRFVTRNYVDVAKIAKVSLFRGTAWGHDYTDGTEACRTMKHYFFPSLPQAEWTTLKITSPVSGSIVEMRSEQAVGTQVRIRSDQFPPFTFVLFHVNVTGHGVGDAVTAGEELGLHASGSTTSDIAVEVATPAGRRLVSYFHLITDELLASYVACGATSRESFVLSKEARDADSATCDGVGSYTNAGTLPGWALLSCP